jgi:hypothetical protein
MNTSEQTLRNAHAPSVKNDVTLLLLQKYQPQGREGRL